MGNATTPFLSPLGPAKRALDVGLVLLTIPFWLPMLALAALAARMAMGRPALFRQERAGLRGRPFRLVKLRTMTDARGPDGQLLPDEARLTPVGRRLRDWSLDELPELFNVLRGDMSLVGPRPLPVRYTPRYSPSQARRLLVRPGLTGLAQVRGRNLLSWEEKFALDVEYVDAWRLGLDLRILGWTVLATLSRRGVRPPDRDTAEEFLGNATARSAADRRLRTNSGQRPGPARGK